MSIEFFVISLCALGQFGARAEIKITFEDSVIKFIDPEYFDPEKTDIFIQEDSSNGGTFFTNVTVVKKVPRDADAHMKLMGLSMGEYKIPTGLDVWMKACEVVNEPVIGAPMFRAIGFTKESCPPGPGTYGQQGYAPPMDLFPDTFPENKYVGIINLVQKKKTFFTLEVYMDIQSE